MYKTFKIRFYPTQEQYKKLKRQFSGQRYIANKYIERNNEAYANGEKFIGWMKFNNEICELKHNNPDYAWIKELDAHGCAIAIRDVWHGYKRFFKNKAEHTPHFKSAKRTNIETVYLDKGCTHLITDRKYIIKIRFLGEIRITQLDYLPIGLEIKSMRIIREYDDYYIAFKCVVERQPVKKKDKHLKLGIDLGIHDYVTTAVDVGKGDIHFIHEDSFIGTRNYKKANEKIKRYNQVIAHKAEVNYGIKLNEFLDKNGREPTEAEKKQLKSESYNTSRIRNLKKKRRKAYKKLANIRDDYINKLCYMYTAIAKPKYITAEDLNVTEMLQKYDMPTNEQSHTLHDSIAQSSFFKFKTKLALKCFEYAIELRLLDQYYPSSKKCSCCGKKKKVLLLSDRVFNCDYCDNVMDRDENAAMNILKANKRHYHILDTE